MCIIGNWWKVHVFRPLFPLMNCVSPLVKYISPMGKPNSQAPRKNWGKLGKTVETELPFVETVRKRWEKGNENEFCFFYKLQLHSTVYLS